MTDHLEHVKQEFTRQAESFASAAALTDEALTARFVEALGPRASGTILDVACGPGIVTAAIAPKAHAVVALDLTPEMLEKARQRCAKAGCDNVTFREGSATELPFAENTFAGVVTRLSMHHFTEPRRALAEMFRVLQPEGRLVLADVVSAEDANASALQNAIEVLRDPSHVRMLPVSELVSLIEGAGFTVEQQAGWEKPREFEEWMGVVNEPARSAPLRTMLQALAKAGQDAGMELSLAGDKLTFVHRWHMVTARKPSA
jgi:ubiquinone/menaquinone biosynthesis C-methylase UbiE